MIIKTFILFLALSGLTKVPANAAVFINGAGATFPYPLYSKWFSEYQKAHPDVQINYQSIGSGGGIRQFLEKTVDFGATDAPMTDEQLSKSANPILHIPTALGAVVLTFNLLGISKLQLSGPVIANIFLGKITKWNDEGIRALNPGAAIPDEPILVVHRSDGSGTSAVFSDYLSKMSADWKSKVGSGTALNWPTGLGGKGNEGVSGLVKQTPGSIGYIELVYAKSNHLAFAAVQNKRGAFIVPSSQTVTAAAEDAVRNMPADFRVSITDASGRDSYPIGAFTYLLVFKEMASEKGRVLTEFLKWSARDGQKYAEPLDYAPLPKSLVTKVEKRIDEIRVR